MQTHTQADRKAALLDQMANIISDNTDKPYTVYKDLVSGVGKPIATQIFSDLSTRGGIVGKISSMLFRHAKRTT